MRVVIDTNVFASSFVSSQGPSARVMDFWKRRKFDLLVSEPILAEYARVLAYPRLVARHGLAPDDVAEQIAELRDIATVVSPAGSLRVVGDDSDDDKFFECAVAGGAAYIVSGDSDLLSVGEYRGIRVLSPRVFVAMLEHNGAP